MWPRKRDLRSARMKSWARHMREGNCGWFWTEASRVAVLCDGLRRCDVEPGRWQWTAESRKIVVKFENTRINSLGEMNKARASQSCGIVYITSPSWGRTDESLGWTGVRLSILLMSSGREKEQQTAIFEWYWSLEQGI